MKKEFLMNVEETSVDQQFELEDHEAMASGAAAFFFFFYNKTA